MKSVLLSIQPKWCELIASGEKTIEIRKTKPKIKTPFKCYIYCTEEELLTKSHINGNIYVAVHKEYQQLLERNGNLTLSGKVIGEFVCNNIDELLVTTGSLVYLQVNGKADLFYNEKTCLVIDDYETYLGRKKGYGWHISDLVIYDKPKELSEFFVCCERCDKRPIACEYAFEESNESGYYSECMCDFKRPIKRPPQSWCYVEEQEG